MSDRPLPTPAKRNVETITALERQLLGQRSPAERMGSGIAHFFGSLWFIGAHTLFLAGWLLLNAKVVPSVEPFDPYPFPFLGFVVGVEFIVLTSFVLMNQKFMARRQEQWAHLNLQICLLTEQEVTKSVQMLHSICQEMGLRQPAQDREAEEMSRATPVTALAEELGKAREVDEGSAGETGQSRAESRPS